MLGLEANIGPVGRSQEQFFPLRNELAGISLAVPESTRFADKPDLITPTPTALTIQASGRWSQQYRDEDPQTVIARLCAIWEDISGQPLPPILDASTHRWLYAKVTEVANENAPRHSDDKKMAIAGDWLKGPRVEQAFDSGTAAYLSLC